MHYILKSERPIKVGETVITPEGVTVKDDVYNLSVVQLYIKHNKIHATERPCRDIILRAANGKSLILDGEIVTIRTTEDFVWDRPKLQKLIEAGTVIVEEVETPFYEIHENSAAWNQRQAEYEEARKWLETLTPQEQKYIERLTHSGAVG